MLADGGGPLRRDRGRRGKLCWAYENEIGITLGGKTWSATDIRVLVDGLDIFILPNLNPDGA